MGIEFSFYLVGEEQDSMNALCCLVDRIFLD